MTTTTQTYPSTKPPEKPRCLWCKSDDMYLNINDRHLWLDCVRCRASTPREPKGSLLHDIHDAGGDLSEEQLTERLTEQLWETLLRYNPKPQ